MIMTIDDVEMIFVSKLNKYRSEALTPELLDILYAEAIFEARAANVINGGVSNG